MTEVTLGGWPAISSGSDPRLAHGKVPGTTKTITLRKEVLPVFLAILSEINKKVIPLNPGPLDSYEYRMARMANGFSQHAGGVATDMRYDVLLADHRNHMTAAQHAAMHKLMDKYVTSTGKRVFGWGGDWTLGTYEDEMHVEAIQGWSPGSHGANATVADFLDVQKRLGIKADGTIPVIQKIINIIKPAPKPPAVIPPLKPNPVTIQPVPVKPAPVPAKPTAPVKISVAQVQPGKKNSQVAVVQAALKKVGHDPKRNDGYFNKDTVTAYSEWQKRLGYTGADADGAPGIKSLTELGKKTGFTVVA